MPKSTKLIHFDELETLRKKGKKLIQCHGVFDLLHPGHIRHFKEAKSLGGQLVVTVTPDRFVNKGPGRPVFNETLRLESLAALADIDYVILNDSPDAISAIQKVKPAYYVKGIEYKNHEKDVTGKIAEEARAVEEVGGQMYYTDDIVFSSSSLLNQHFDALSPIVKNLHLEDVVQKIEELSSLRVLVIGDAIIDEYQYVDPIGQSGKGVHMVARCQEKEVFLGGALIMANHVAQFTNHVTLATAIGKDCPYRPLIQQKLDPRVKREFTLLEHTTTLIKKRYVVKDGISKLFETYSGNEKCLNETQTAQMTHLLRERASEFDLVLVCDFGNGFTNPQLIETLSDLPTFLAVNTQTNSGNRGFNVVTNYRRADYISLNEPEIRLAARDRSSSLEGIVADISEVMNCQRISVTRGMLGVLCIDSKSQVEIPALATNSVDRIGAGDNYFSVSALCAAKGYSPALFGLIGSAAAAMSIQIVGNRESVQKSSLLKFITRLLK